MLDKTRSTDLKESIYGGIYTHVLIMTNDKGEAFKDIMCLSAVDAERMKRLFYRVLNRKLGLKLNYTTVDLEAQAKKQEEAKAALLRAEQERQAELAKQQVKVTPTEDVIKANQAKITELESKLKEIEQPVKESVDMSALIKTMQSIDARLVTIASTIKSKVKRSK